MAKKSMFKNKAETLARLSVEIITRKIITLTSV